MRARRSPNAVMAVSASVAVLTCSCRRNGARRPTSRVAMAMPKGADDAAMAPRARPGRTAADGSRPPMSTRAPSITPLITTYDSEDSRNPMRNARPGMRMSSGRWNWAPTRAPIQPRARVRNGA